MIFSILVFVCCIHYVAGVGVSVWVNGTLISCTNFSTKAVYC